MVKEKILERLDDLYIEDGERIEVYLVEKEGFIFERWVDESGTIIDEKDITDELSVALER